MHMTEDGLTRRGVIAGALSAAVVAGGDATARGATRPRVPRALKADVCVVGAGISGLITARRLLQGGVRKVVVLEANARVGGRTLNFDIGGGHVTEAGGEWVGPSQHRVLALIRELGLETFKTYVTGDTVFLRKGARTRYAGTIPPLDPAALADFVQAQTRLEQMAATVPLERPWEAPQAAAWDGTTMGQWMDSNLISEDARFLLTLALSIINGQDPHGTSLLYTLFVLASCGGLDALINTTGGGQESRIVGGSQQLSLVMAKALGRRVIRRSPVTAIDQRGRNHAIVYSARATVTCGAVVIAMSPADARRITVRPELPILRRMLQKNWQVGTGLKVFAIYDDPFWRADGLNGQAITDLRCAGYTSDNSPPDGKPGVLLTFLGAANESAPSASVACCSTIQSPAAVPSSTRSVPFSASRPGRPGRISRRTGRPSRSSRAASVRGRPG